MNQPPFNSEDIAIIGMAGRFPGAPTLQAFWNNLCQGIEAIEAYDTGTLKAAGVPEETLARPNYVKAGCLLEDLDKFDAPFFGFTPHEAAATDPQQRVFLESIWHALEDAGHDPNIFRGAIGLFAGKGQNLYQYRFIEHPELFQDLGLERLVMLNEKDFLASWAAYKLNLRGPAYTIQTACSTSLAAVHLACQSLIQGDCRMAIAGGVRLHAFEKQGYFYQEGGIQSPDGHCRAFDAHAKGTVGGSGTGLVVLRLAEDAWHDGDRIYAVIKGSAANNDGANKVGYTAPSVAGQAAAIQQAYTLAGIDPATIGFIEAHGTATPMGDPIEVEALSQAFGSQRPGYCALGSVKTNLGHLDAAAGVAGLMKAALAVYHHCIPASLHFKQPNPALNLDQSPFYVNAETVNWPSSSPRRAGVSSFGIGGTNVHVVLEEAPLKESAVNRRPCDLLIVSAKSQAALNQRCQDLAEWLEDHPNAHLGDVLSTLRQGRSALTYRQYFVVKNLREASDQLQAAADSQGAKAAGAKSQIAMLFPGQGSQYLGMGAALYKLFPIYQKFFDQCAELALAYGVDLHEIVFNLAKTKQRAIELGRTENAQPAIFAVNYALARLWIHLGIRPKYLMGHSLGEYVAACLAGVFDLKDAVALVVARGRAMQAADPGAMLAVPMAAEALRSILPDTLTIASINAPRHCVVSGPQVAVDTFAQQLTDQGQSCKQLVVSHAFHSPMMDTILDTFRHAFTDIQLNPPKVQTVSGVTGKWLTSEQACDPDYWVQQLRQPVQFAVGMATLNNQAALTFLETGPRNVLTQFARMNGVKRCYAALPQEPTTTLQHFLNTVGELWLEGFAFRWDRFDTNPPRRLSLPLYPFQRQRHWLEGTAEKQKPDKITLPETDQSILDKHANTPNQAATQPSGPKSAPHNHYLEKLKALFNRLFGFPVDDIDPQLTYYELGVDSLLLLQAGNAVRNEFQLDIATQQLFEEHTTLHALANYLVAQFPEPTVQEQTPTPADLSSENLHQSSPHTSLPTVQNLPDGDPDLLALLEKQTLITLDLVKQLRGEDKPDVAAQRKDPNPSRTPRTETARKGASVESRGVTPFASQTTETDLSRDPDKRALLQDFIDRYVQKTRQSRNWNERHRRTHADARNASNFHPQWRGLAYRIVCERAEGPYVWDLDGNQLVDLTNSFGASLLGHNPTVIDEALRKRLDLGIQVGSQSQLAGPVAERLTRMTQTDRAAFCNSGSEAVMHALRIARGVTGRRLVVAFSGSYHGIFDGVMGRPGPGGRSLPLAPGTPPGMVEDIHFLPYGEEASLNTIREKLPQLAAVLVEPVQSRYPDLFPVAFLRELRTMTRQSGTALIFDEMITGFRCHPGGIGTLLNIDADLFTYGKVLGGGMPIGAVAGKALFMDAIDGGGQWTYAGEDRPGLPQTIMAGTFCKHPLAMAAAEATLAHLEDQGPALQETLTQRTTALAARLQELFDQRGIPAKVAHFASLFRIVPQKRMPTLGLLEAFLGYHGLHAWEGGNLFLTTTHSAAIVDQIVAGFAAALDDMQRIGLLETGQDSGTRQAGSRRLPLIDGQRQIYLTASMHAQANAALNEKLFIHLDAFDPVSVSRVLRQLVARHDALRVTIATDGKRQVFNQPDDAYPLDILDARGMTDQSQRLMVQTLERRAFDLTNGPLFAPILLRLDDDRALFVLIVHHIVVDAWSMTVLIREFQALYEADRQGKSLLKPPASFADYVATILQSNQEKAHAYWFERLRHYDYFECPFDHVRPRAHGFKGRQYRTLLKQEQVIALKQQAGQSQVTVFNWLLAAYHAFLYHLTEKKQSMVGIPQTGQLLFGREDLVGYTLSIVPHLIELDPSQTFAHFLGQVKANWQEAVRHREFNLKTVLDKLGQRPEPGRYHPLFGMVFNLDPGMSRETQPQLGLIGDLPVKGDLGLNLNFCAAGLIIAADYDTALFEDTTISDWMDRFPILIEKFIADPQQPIAVQTPMAAAEIRELLAAIETNQYPYPREVSVKTVFDTVVAQQPDAVAVLDDKQQMTYAALSHATTHIANLLWQRGVRQGDRVVLAMDRSHQLVAAMLGVLAVGAVSVPVDIRQTEEHCHKLCVEVDAKVILVDQDHQSEARHLKLQGNLTRMSQPKFQRPPGPEGGDIATILFTSGTTGRPKGVCLPHRGLVRLIVNNPYLPLQATDVITQTVSASFDPINMEVWGALFNGARLAVVPRDTLLNPIALKKWLRDHHITYLTFMATLFHQYAQESPDIFDGLTCLIVGGEALHASAANRVMQRTQGPMHLLNAYGPTESSTNATTFTMDRMGVEGLTVPIGKAIGNTWVHVLDNHMRLSVPRAIGQLYIGGDGLALGYWKRPRRTAQSFLPDPFATTVGGRLYKTGDKVKRDLDGNILFLGRDDHQVKLRGFRIELEGIMAVINQMPGVIETLVIAHKTPNPHLAAYVVPANTAAIDAGAVAAFLKGRLPDYMVPTTWAILDELPRLTNDKVDHRALPPAHALEETKSPMDDTPLTGTTAEIIAIWQDLLKLTQVRPGDNYFNIGGDSISAIRVATRLRKAGWDLSPIDIYHHQTPRELAQFLDKQHGESAQRQMPVPVAEQTAQLNSEHPLASMIETLQPLLVDFNFSAPAIHTTAELLDAKGIAPSQVEDVYPASPLQEGLVFHALSQPNTPFYISHFFFQTPAPLVKQDFRQAIQWVVDQQPVLRTFFLGDDQLPDMLQVVLAEVPIAVDWLTMPDAKAADAVSAFLADERQRGMDVTQAPLMTVRVLMTASGHHYLSWRFHHALLDGWSTPMVRDQVFAVYRDLQADRQPQVTSVRPYRDYLLWLRKRDKTADKFFWCDYLHDFHAVTPLGWSQVAPPRGGWSPQYVQEDMVLNDQSTSKLNALARKHKLSPGILCQGMWAVMLSRFARTNDVVFGSVTSGRPVDLHGVETMVGMFLNTLPIRVQVSPDRPLTDWLAELQLNMAQVRQHEQVPLATIRRWIGHSAREELFHSLCAFQNLPGSNQTQDSGLDVQTFDNPHYPLTVLFYPGSKLRIRTYVDEALLEPGTGPAILEQLKHLFEQLEAHMNSPLRNLCLTSEHARRQILTQWNADLKALPTYGDLGSYFDKVAAATPEKIVSITPTQRITYGTLQAQANKLAHALLQRRISGEATVGVLMNRSTDLLIAYLGILKAGAVFVPLDTQAPVNRLVQLATHAKIHLLLHHQKGDSSPWETTTETLALDSVLRDRKLATAQPNQPVDGNQIAHILFTSGSTGKPRGVAIRHASIAQLLFENCYMSFDSKRTVVHTSNLAFDASTYEIWAALLHGASLLIMPDGMQLDPPAFLSYLTAHGADTSLLTTSLFHQMIRYQPDFFAHMRDILVGGEALNPGIAALALGNQNGPQYINCYGPTECTVFAVRHAVQDVHDHALTVPIGKPLSSAAAFICNDQLELCAPGEPGELLLGGMGLARGYHRRPARTAQAFVPNPFSTHSGSRLYRTGDLVRWNPVGEIIFLGRLDFQVKLRGFRIELAEIELALRALPDIQEAVVLVHESGDDRRQLVGYIAAPSSVDARSAQQQLTAMLPKYMVPTKLIRLDKLPITANGKLDRKALPAPNFGSQSEGPAKTAPRNALEEQLATLWCDVLGLAEISVHDNYFDLGGDSILAIKLVTKARKLDLPLRVTQLFRFATIAQLAAHLAESQTERTESWQTGPDVFGWDQDSYQKLIGEVAQANQQDPQRIVDLYPLSPLQEGMLFHSLAEAEGAYVTQIAAKIETSIDHDVLQQAINKVINHHAALRTWFDWEHVGTAVQVVMDKVAAPVERQDWTTVSAEQAKKAWLAFTATDRRRGIDLRQAPVMRVTVVDLADNAHFLLWTCNHIVIDGWSWPILFNHLFQAYDAIQNNRHPDLNPSRPFGDYIAWVKQQDVQKAEQYWQTQLNGLTAASSLGKVASEPFNDTTSYHQPAAILSREDSANIRAGARRHQVTLNSFMSAAWALLLRHYTQRDDVMFGSVTSGRPDNLPGSEDMIGLLINTLPTRLQIKGETPLDTWLTQVQAVQTQARQHGFLSLIRIQGVSDVPIGTPLFESVIAFENIPLGTSDGTATCKPGIANHVHLLNSGGAPDHPLAWTIFPEAQIQIHLSCAANRFDSLTADQLLHHYQHLLRSMTSQVNPQLKSLSPIDAAERAQLIRKWNQTANERDPQQSFMQAIHRQAQDAGDCAAVSFQSQSLTYTCLMARVRSLTTHMRILGVEESDLVGITCHRSPDLVIAVLAVFELGASYMPIADDIPQDRLAVMLDETEPALVLLTEGTTINLPREVQVFPVNQAQIGASANPTTTYQPNARAYVIYTSGSTGRPKGVMVSYAAIANRMWWAFDRFPMAAQNRFLQLAAFSFDISLWEIVGPLMAGAHLVLAPPNAYQDMAAVGHAVSSRQISDIHFVPSVLQAFLEDIDVETGRSLKRVYCGGESLTEPLRRLCLGRLQAELHHWYGPTEASINVTSWPAHEEADNPVPIGRPISNTQLYLVDRWLNIVATGVSGELLIGGNSLAVGYLNNPVQTAMRFLPDPFSNRPGQRLYATGDRAYYRQDGALIFSGRQDDQFKIRGHRIEPGDIETALDKHPAVHRALVTAKPQLNKKLRIIAYIVTNQRAPNDAEMRDYLSSRIPEYMIPTDFVSLDSLPLTSHGKPDRKALPEPDWRPVEEALVLPRNKKERQLAGVWCDVLNLKQVGVHENFFRIGGDSISAIQVTARAKQQDLFFGVRELFKHPTIADLATLNLTSTSEKQITHPRLGWSESTWSTVQEALDQQFGEDALDDAYPLAPLQEGMLFHALYEPKTGAYINRVTCRITRHVHVAAWQTAFQLLLDNYDILRTAFAWQNLPNPVQAVFNGATIPITYIDFENLDQTACGNAWQDILHRDSARGFSMSRPPLMRVTLARISADETWLAWTYHHILLDGWSVRRLITLLLNAYQQITDGKTPTLPALPKFRRYLDWLSRQDRAKAKQWWQKQLVGFEAPGELTLGAESTQSEDHAPASISRALSIAQTERLRVFARQAAVTENTLITTAWSLLLSQITGSDDVLFGVTTSGRPADLDDVESMIGLFINTLPLRVKIPQAVPVNTWLAEMHDLGSELTTHGYLPLTQLRSISGLAQGTPFFESLVVYENMPHSRSEGAAYPGFEMMDPLEHSHLPLSILVFPGSRLTFTIHYNADRFSAKAVKVLLSRLISILDTLPEHGHAPVQRLPLLSEQEGKRILNLASRPMANPPIELAVHEWFQQNVSHKPDAVALVVGSQTLTYAQLNETANRKAQALVEAGVRPGQLVGIALNRRTSLIECLLAVLKLGAAYVPLDPTYPAERIAFILEDAGASTVITEQSLGDLVTDVHDICLYEDALTCDRSPSAVAKVPLAAPSHVIYTSGSTGCPKGVVIRHDSVNALFNWCQRALVDCPLDVLASTSICFDLSIFEIFGTLARGGTIILAENALALANLPARSRIGMINTVPSAMESLLSSGAIPPTVRAVALAGEALAASLVGELYNCHHIDHVYNLYGPSEDTTYSTWARIPETLTGEPEIGEPLDGSQALVVDHRLRLVGQAIPGMLCLAGAGLSSGYHNQPRLTALRFLPNPFTDLPGARLYLTGDRVCLKTNGRLAFLGRSDHQVKIRGYRIELGEIEAVLRQWSAVEDCVVQALPNHQQELTLTAFVVMRNHTTDMAIHNDIRQWLNQRLPNFFVPNQIFLLTAFPRTPNGKIDRKALPKPRSPQNTGASEGMAPRNDTEQKVAAIWQEVLGVHPIGVADSFISLGGHSLHMIRIHAQIEATFACEIPMNQLFTCATIAEMAVFLTQNQVKTSLKTLVAIKPNGSKPPIFLVPPMSGEAIAYRELAEHMPPDQPLYSFQAPGLTDIDEQHPSLKAMATQNVQRLLAQGFRAPFTIGGWSFGGYIAYEMACQLRQSGHQVNHLILLDTMAPIPAVRNLRVPDDIELLHGLARDAALTHGVAPPDFDEQWQQASHDKKMASLAAFLQVHTGMTADRGQAWLEKLVHGWRIREAALHDYQPSPHYDGLVRLIKATEIDPHQAAKLPLEVRDLLTEPHMGWTTFVPESAISVRKISAHHANLASGNHAINLAKHLDLGRQTSEVI